MNLQLKRRGVWRRSTQPSRGPRILLPERHRFAHSLVMYFHDQMVDILAYGDRYRLWETEVRLREETHVSALQAAQKRGEALEWLSENGYNEEVGKILLRKVFPALLSDFCVFLFEALKCSERGRLTAAYALLRKPFRENLLFLEMLLTSPQETLHRFMNQPIESMKLGSLLSNRTKVIQTITDARASILGKEAFSPEFIWELRYGKQVPYGLDNLWNKALHLVTDKTYHKTEDQNLNFIFSANEEHGDQWDYLYRTLPMLTYYASSVSASLSWIAFDEPLPYQAERSLRDMIGFILLGRWATPPKEHEDLLKGLELKCTACKTRMSHWSDLEHLFHYQWSQCKGCNGRVWIGDLLVKPEKTP